MFQCVSSLDKRRMGRAMHDAVRMHEAVRMGRAMHEGALRMCKRVDEKLTCGKEHSNDRKGDKNTS